jgi:hypothetical protein
LQISHLCTCHRIYLNILLTNYEYTFQTYLNYQAIPFIFYIFRSWHNIFPVRIVKNMSEHLFFYYIWYILPLWIVSKYWHESVLNRFHFTIHSFVPHHMSLIVMYCFTRMFANCKYTMHTHALLLLISIKQILRRLYTTQLHCLPFVDGEIAITLVFSPNHFVFVRVILKIADDNQKHWNRHFICDMKQAYQIDFL